MSDYKLLPWSPAAVVRRGLDYPEHLTVSEWADRCVVIPAKQAIDRVDTRYESSRSPYQKGILDAYGRADVSRITIMGPAQGGKTLPMYICLLYTIDRDPGPSLYVMPDEKMARKNTRLRILPLIRHSPVVARHMTGAKDDESSFLIGLDAMDVHVAWANSPSALASTPVYRVFLDEVDKYPGFSGREASPAKLAEDRLKNFVGAKLMEASTPTTRNGLIYGDYLQSNQQQYYVPCLNCGRCETLKFSQVKWPKDMRDHEQVRRRRLATYECEHCMTRFDNGQKNQMVSRGVWCPKGCTVEDGNVRGEWPDSGHYGFWFNSLYATFDSVTLSHCASQFLEAHNSQDRSKLMDFQNSWMSDIWEEKISEITVDSVAKLRADYDTDTVPDAAYYITCGVDVQLHELYYVVRAWGMNEESWRMAYGVVESGRLEDFERDVLHRVWPWSHGRRLGIGLTCIDSRYRTEEVYAFCGRHLDRVRPVQGATEHNAPPMSAFAVDRNKYGKAVRGGLQYWRVNTNIFKDKIMRLQGQSGDDVVVLWHIPKTATDDYVRGISSEQKVIQRDSRNRPHFVWTPKPGNPANHPWDCEVYNVVAADLAGVRYLLPPPIPAEVAPAQKSAWMQTEEESWF
jgi:phage terminase large subunit GpA-like protein